MIFNKRWKYLGNTIEISKRKFIFETKESETILFSSFFSSYLIGANIDFVRILEDI